MSEQPDPPPSSTGEGGQVPPVETPHDTSKDNFVKKALAELPAAGAPVGAGGITLVASFLIILTLSLLYNITAYWPVCDLSEEEANANTAGATNTNAAGGTNNNAAVATNANANRSAANTSNANAAATPGASSNAANNTNANANTNAPNNTNANAGTRRSAAASNASARAAASPGASPSTNANANTVAPTIEPNSGPITGKTLVTIKGKNLGNTAEGLVVKFGERKAQIRQVSDNTISVSTPRHSEGLVDVTIERGSEAITMASAFTYTCPAPSGRTLFIMLILAGGLGGCIHALRSFYWYVGQGDLRWRWMPMYFSLPFVGAAMAMIFSLLIIAGFVDNTTGKSTALFIIAAAGLVGMFSQQAALKLTDIANAFFTKPGEGKNPQPQASLPVSAGGTKATPVTATAMDKNTGKAAGGDIVKITGSGFNTSTTVSFGGNPARVTTFDATSITVVTPAGQGKVDVEVSSGGPAVKLPVKFEYVP